VFELSFYKAGMHSLHAVIYFNASKLSRRVVPANRDHVNSHFEHEEEIFRHLNLYFEN
jgi:hypothetical protein